MSARFVESQTKHIERNLAVGWRSIMRLLFGYLKSGTNLQKTPMYCGISRLYAGHTIQMHPVILLTRVIHDDINLVADS